MGKRGVPDSDIPEAPKTGTVRRGKRTSAKKKGGDFNAEMAVLRLTVDTMDPETVRAAVVEAVNNHGEAKVFEALRSVQMPEEFLAPVTPATTQDVAPVTSADNSLPATQPAAKPATEPAAAAPAAANPATDQALPKPGTFTVKDVLAGKVPPPEAAAQTVASATPAPAGVQAANAGQPSPAAQQAAVEAVTQPARSEYQPTSQELLGQLEAAYGPGFPPFTPAESAVNPLIGLAEQGFAGGQFPVADGQPGRVRLINPVLPPAIPRAASMEEIMRGLGMSEPSADPGRLQADISEAPEMLPANAADGVGTFQVVPPRPGIKQMQESLQQAAQPEVPAAPKQSIYEKLGMNPPADMGTSTVYKNIPTGLKAAGILGLLGAGAAYGLGAFGGQPQQQPQGQPENDFQKAQRILMTPMKFGP